MSTAHLNIWKATEISHFLTGSKAYHVKCSTESQPTSNKKYGGGVVESIKWSLQKNSTIVCRSLQGISGRRKTCIVVGAARFFKSWPYFRPQNVIFHTRFQTRPLKSIPVFRPGLYAEIILPLLRLKGKLKIEGQNFFKSFSNWHISFYFLLIWN